MKKYIILLCALFVSGCSELSGGFPSFKDEVQFLKKLQCSTESLADDRYTCKSYNNSRKLLHEITVFRENGGGIKKVVVELNYQLGGFFSQCSSKGKSYLLGALSI